MLYQSKTITMSENIVLAKLYKKLYPSEMYATSSEGILYDTLGYYDSIEFIPVSNIDDLIKETNTQETGLEKAVLIPASDKKISCVSCMPGAISFIIVDEKLDTDLIKFAKDFEDAIDVKGIICKTYVTMGASAIAIISFNDNQRSFVNSYTKYLNELQKYTSPVGRTIYTFTVFFLNADAFEYNDEILETLYITFAWKKEKSLEAEFYLDLVARLINAQTFDSGMLAGTDDYYLFAKQIKFLDIVNLFKSGNLLASKKDNSEYWYGYYCDATFTALGFTIENCDNVMANDKEKRKALEETNTVDVISVNDTFSTTKLNRFPLMRGIGKSFSAFKTLNESKYTQWVYRYYEPIVRIYASLLDDCLKSPAMLEDITVVQDAHRFFVQLNQMLESLLNTSAYFTDSPGFRRVESNCIPRLLLYYQRKINNLVASWDNEYDTQIKREHIFMLCSNDQEPVQASMFFRALPPDKRLVMINIPMQQAYQPAVLLPLLLHEIGHYIGVRHRNDSNSPSITRATSFLNVAVQRFYIELLKYMFEMEYPEIIRLYKDPAKDIKQCEDSSYVAHMIVTLLEGDKALKEMVTDRYQEYKKLVVEDCRKRIKDIEIRDREIYAIENNYFYSMYNITYGVFETIMETDFVFNCLNRHFRVCIDQLQSEEELFRNIYNELLDRLDIAFERMRDELNKPNGICFLKESEEMLSEVAADIFMTSMSGMDSAQYLCMVYEQYAVDYRNLEDMIMDFEETPAANIRVLAVIFVLNKHKKKIMFDRLSTFEKKRLQSIAQTMVLSNSIPSSNKNEIYRSIEEGYIKLKRWLKNAFDLIEEAKNLQGWENDSYRLLSSTESIMQYAQLLYEDARYSLDEHKEKLRKEITDMQTIYATACDAIEGKNTMSAIFNLLYDPA